jgi:hypothetical protein
MAHVRPDLRNTHTSCDGANHSGLEVTFTDADVGTGHGHSEAKPRRETF